MAPHNEGGELKVPGEEFSHANCLSHRVSVPTKQRIHGTNGLSTIRWLLWYTEVRKIYHTWILLEYLTFWRDQANKLFFCRSKMCWALFVTSCYFWIFRDSERISEGYHVLKTTSIRFRSIGNTNHHQAEPNNDNGNTTMNADGSMYIYIYYNDILICISPIKKGVIFQLVICSFPGGILLAVACCISTATTFLKWIKTSNTQEAQHNLFTFICLPCTVDVWFWEKTVTLTPPIKLRPLPPSTLPHRSPLFGTSKERDVHGRHPQWSHRSWCPSSCQLGD